MGVANGGPMKSILFSGVIGLALLTGCSKAAPPADSQPKVEAKTETKTEVQPEKKPEAATPSPSPTPGGEVAVLKTSAGEMVVELWADTAPKTVENFKKLAKDGFYDGTAFHRIINGFMIQGGDPLTKDASKESMWGTGDPGYKIQGEVSDRPNRAHLKGVLSMANSGHPDTAGCQFFICLAPQPRLDGGYTTFGKVIKGEDVLEKLGKSPVKPDPRGEPSRPIERVALESVKIVPAESIK
jgi:peptidyl-prolyl cis-trans isomerase B (cyclophilin B)